MIIEQLIAQLGFETTGMDAARSFQRAMGSIDRQMQAFGRTIRNVTVAMGAYFALKRGVWTLFGAREVIQTAADWEILERRMKTLLGTTEKVGEAMDYIQKFAIQTPYGTKEAAEAYTKLVAYGFNQQELKPMLEGVADTAYAMGKDLMQGVEAVADAVNGDFRRFREFFSMNWDAQSKKGFVTFTYKDKEGNDVTKTVEKTRKALTDFLLQYMVKFKGAATASVGSWTQMMDRLTDLFEIFKRKIANKGFFDFITKKLRDLTQWMSDHWDTVLDSWAQKISDFYIGLYKATERFFYHTRDNINTLVDLWNRYGDVLNKVAAVMGGLLIVMSPFLRFVAQLSFLLLLIDDFLGYLQGKKSVFGDFVEWLTRELGIETGKAEKWAGFAAILTGVLALVLPAVIAQLAAVVGGAILALFTSAPVILAISLSALAAITAFIYHFRHYFENTEAWTWFKTFMIEKGKQWGRDLLDGFTQWLTDKANWLAIFKAIESAMRTAGKILLFPFEYPIEWAQKLWRGSKNIEITRRQSENTKARKRGEAEPYPGAGYFERGVPTGQDENYGADLTNFPDETNVERPTSEDDNKTRNDWNNTVDLPESDKPPLGNPAIRDESQPPLANQLQDIISKYSEAIKDQAITNWEITGDSIESASRRAAESVMKGYSNEDINRVLRSMGVNPSLSNSSTVNNNINVTATGKEEGKKAGEAITRELEKGKYEPPTREMASPALFR